MRVIAGSARNIKLDSLEGEKTRPTTDKVKGAIFSMISTEIYGSNVLDLFSGSGGIAIEAASRGCEKATIVEENYKCKAIIQFNVKRTKLENIIDIQINDAYKFIENSNPKEYDIIFMDPPYSKNMVNLTMEKIVQCDIINEDGIIICEHDIKDEINENYEGLEFIKKKKYGRIGISVFRRK